MLQKERYWVPSRSYDIKASVKNLDLEIYNVEIVTSVARPYQTIIIDFFIDPDDVILEEIYGGEIIKLSITLLQEIEQPSDELNYELIYVSNPGGFDMTIKNINSEIEQQDRSPMKIITVPKNSYITMNTLINKIYLDKTPKEMIEDYVAETKATLEYDTEKQFIETIDQTIIPPLTLYKSLHYLDSVYGLHTGITTYYCDYENTLKIMNLTTRIKQPQIFTIYQLTNGSNNDDIMEKSLDGKHFYTYNNISSDYIGNSVFAVLAKTMKHIVKPRDTLYTLIEKDLETLSEEQGLISKNAIIRYDTNIERTKYYTDHTGYDSSETFINTAKKISSLAVLGVLIEKNLNVPLLIRVGEPVIFETKNPNYIDLTGKYILRSSDINFYRQGDWQATCSLTLMRTTKTN